VENLSLVAIGSSGVIEGLSIMGADVLIVDNPKKDEEVLVKVMEAVSRYKAVIIEEDVYQAVKGKLETLLSGMRYPPLVIVIPGIRGKGTSRLKDLHELLSTAVGVRLRWPR